MQREERIEMDNFNISTPDLLDSKKKLYPVGCMGFLRKSKFVESYPC